MQTELSQVRGMILYEFKMHWRRRALLVITLAMLLLVIVINLVGGESLGQLINQAETVTSDENVTYAYTLSAMIATWTPIAVILAFILPVMLVDTIPLDRQYHMSELFNTFPLSPSTYLIGKLMGAWLAVLAGLLLVGIITTFSWWLRSDKLNLSLFIGIGLFIGISLTIMNGGLGILLGVGQPNRRRAVMVAVIGFFFLAFLTGANPIDLLHYANPARLDLITFFIPIETAGLQELPQIRITNEVLLSIIVGIVQLLIFWGLAWGWLRWRGETA